LQARAQASLSVSSSSGAPAAQPPLWIRSITDARDLPEYAGRLFDAYELNPKLRRLATWRRLERGAPHPQLEPLLENNRVDIAAIARAQKEGHIPNRFAAVELLTIVLTVAAMWMSQTPELTSVLQRLSRARRRTVVVDAVKAVLAY
jgi:Tetracyclin repressor-like, C-terminal domain